MNPDTTIWKSGCVKRWHANIDHNLRESGDNTAQHQWRTAILLNMLHPMPSAHLLMCALTHDVPEVMTGDLPRPVKIGSIKEALEQLEGVIIKEMGLPVPSDTDKAWITLCDQLDAYLWVRDVAFHQLYTQEWQEHWMEITKMAKMLGVEDKVKELVG